jgi:hypothetical protein
MDGDSSGDEHHGNSLELHDPTVHFHGRWFDLGLAGMHFDYGSGVAIVVRSYEFCVPQPIRPPRFRPRGSYTTPIVGNQDSVIGPVLR